MKTSTLLLTGSVALNVALGVIFFGSSPDASAPAPVAAAPRPTSVVPATPGADTWQGLLADDLAAQRDRLRAEGFPPEIIRAILSARVRERFADRRKALETAIGEQPFWKNATPDLARQAELRALAKEESAALKALLGPDLENGYIANLRRQLPGLSDERLDQLSSLRERYDEQRQAIYGSAPSSITPADREKMRAIDKALHDEIASVLTPAELEDYDLRTSNVANNLRYNLTAFNATEAEFRALYRLQSESEATSPMLYGSMTPEQSRARGEVQRKLQDDIKAALGTARYEEYQRATDYDYRQSTQLIARLGLPVETANQLFALREAMQPRISAIEGDRALPAAERTTQLAALNAEAQSKITAVLGSQGYEAYKIYGGAWLQRFTPSPPRSSAAAPAR